jgi:hypothetical protein
MTDHSPDAKLSRYAIPQGVLAGGVAMFFVMFGARWLDLAVPLRRSYNGRFALMVGTFFVVGATTVVWRVFRRARDPSLYRASGRAWTVNEDPRDGLRALATGFMLGAAILAVFWLTFGRGSVQ